MTDAAEEIDVAGVRAWLAGAGETAFLDVREEGQHGTGHPLLAVNLPYSRLEIEIARLVPRHSCRIVLIDDGDGVALRAARRLAALGYGALHRVAGGAAAWQAAGYPLFPSTNVPSKAFAELVEHMRATPAITASELDRRRRDGEAISVLDSRTVEEYTRFHVPGARSCPGAELVLRFADLVPSPDSLVVVSCAGRTRGIIGAQSLIDAGVPNRVMALAGGTQGWRLAGLDLAHGGDGAPVSLSAAGRAQAEARAEGVARRFAIPGIDHRRLAECLAEGERTTYLLDVRTPEEFDSGHLPGSVSAPGGQLVQAIDRWVGTRGARLVLVDDNGVRATMTARWLKEMGWDVQVLDAALAGVPLAHGPAPPQAAAPLPESATLSPEAASRALEAEGALAISLDPSAAYRAAHPPGALWSIRPRLARIPGIADARGPILLFAAEPAVARLAVVDLGEIATAAIALVEGGTAAWRRAGLPVVATRDDPPDARRIDTIFWNHDRHAGNEAAMRAYLDWETGLPNAVAADGLALFRLGAA